MINKITLGGKVVSEVALKKSKSGLSVVDFRLMYKGARTKNSLFIDVEIWGNEAEKIAQRVRRGGMVVVDGELRRDVWEKDGAERSKIKITASRVVIISDADYQVEAFEDERPSTVRPRPVPAAPKAGSVEEETDIPF